MADIAAFTPQFSLLQGRGREFPSARVPASGEAGTAADGGASAEMEAFASLSMRSEFLLELSAEGRARASVAAAPPPPAAPPPSAYADLFEQIASDPEMRKLMTLLKGISGEAYDDFLARFRDFAGSVAGNAPPDPASDLSALAGKIREGLAGIARGVERARSVSASAQVDVEIRFEFYMEDRRIRAEVEGAMSDPLVLDLDGNGFDLTSYETDGVRFDIDGDGRIDRTGFVGPGDGLLALDRDGNGAIDDGGELFGDQHGAANGFAELSKFDDNGDGAIDRKDAVHFRLLVWQDLDRNGKSSPGELRSLADHGIERLDLASRERDETVNGNRLARSGAFYTSDGRPGGLGEAWFRYSTTV